MYNEIIVLGVLLSLLFAEFTGVSPAGLVVAGYIALSLQTPLRIAYTLLIVLLTWGAFKLLSRYMLLFGRRQFAVMILVSFALAQLLGLLLPYDPGIIGYLVPGIMANQFVRQGPVKTLLALTVVVGFLALFMFLAGIPVF